MAPTTDTITKNIGGIDLTFVVELVRDDDSEAPWSDDGHGPVTPWLNRNKKPGELLLSEERGMRQYYKFDEACQIARHESWDAAPHNDGSETPRQQAAKAARADFEYLRDWCNGNWHYVGVVVTLLDDDGDKTEVSDSLWRVENRDNNHWITAETMADELAAGMGTQWGWEEKIVKVANWIKAE